MNLVGSVILCPFDKIIVLGLLTDAYELPSNGLLARFTLPGMSFLLCVECALKLIRDQPDTP